MAFTTDEYVNEICTVTSELSMPIYDQYKRAAEERYIFLLDMISRRQKARNMSLLTTDSNDELSTSCTARQHPSQSQVPLQASVTKDLTPGNNSQARRTVSPAVVLAKESLVVSGEMGFSQVRPAYNNAHRSKARRNTPTVYRPHKKKSMRDMEKKLTELHEKHTNLFLSYIKLQSDCASIKQEIKRFPYQELCTPANTN
jgi:hypothetical protein